MGRRVAILAVFALVVGSAGARAEEGRATKTGRVDFNRDIRPILSKNCFACHGRDARHREGGLRLDERDGAVRMLESSKRAVVPGKPEASELVRRIVSRDDSLQMPPPDSNRKLTKREIALLQRWIAEGAAYARHWAFIKPKRPVLPSPVDGKNWVRNPIDAFILSRMQRHGLKPAVAADRHILIRRLSLDLRGVPPTPQEVRRFVDDKSPDAWEQIVDRFLNDPRYGERWRVWLDLARYADSRGYGSDPLRPNIWRYRDWVIDAFNRNNPFDEFTIHQLAGDLVKNPTLDQKIATAFHRNTMTNTEGGTDDEEFRVAAVRDRVDTTIQVWMGLTMGCAKCHSHKYDPIKQTEYYRFYAFFNQSADADRPDESPVISAPRRQDLEAIALIDKRIADLKRQLNAGSSALQAAQRRWELQFRSTGRKIRQARFVRIELPGRRKLLSLAEVQVFSGGRNAAQGAKARQSSTDFNGPAQLAVDGNTNGDYNRAQSTTHTKLQNDPWWEVDLGKPLPVGKVVIWNRTDNNLQSRLAGFRVILLDAKRNPVWTRVERRAPRSSVALTPGGIRSTVTKRLLAVIDTPENKRTGKQKVELAAYYRSIAPSLKQVRAEIARLEKSKPKLPTVPVMQELPPEKRRKTYVMIRGNFLAKGEAVKPGVPAAFHAFPEGVPRSRLGVARWLVHRDNPLTARVAVNRFWGRIFGIGIVETEEDFGTQGELPSHPELLDWLSVELQASGWNVKRLLKLIVTSATYRQTSRVKSARVSASVDPRNRLLSRFPRNRLEAEMVRDQALKLSGLLRRKMMGPSVYPPQPPGLWRAAFNGQRKWPTSTGADRYRRGVYTFWRRTVPYPSMATFDAPSREICTVRRIRTNTPLQAFVTMNDPVYVEAAQSLARRIMKEGGRAAEERAKFAYFLCTSRPPNPSQTAALLRLYQSELRHYASDAAAATKVSTDPLGPLPSGIKPAEAAAWTVVANVLLNLDAVLTRN